ncbi:transposase [Aquihabitans sp. G128]|uniref:transposase n=1 Tax=Aquihabitans sp. G128 TaxID=2849779 RepID=UPI001C211389|nr:transposase [Aquihabitans sp. G128]QXC59369.1 transposase [Aquihabitans sp. G128]
MDRIDHADAAIHRWLVAYSITVLRVSLGVVFLGFGVLKLFPGVSPAESIVVATTDAITSGVVPGRVAMVATALAEITVGLTFTTGRYMRAAVWLLTFMLIGVLSPLVVLTSRLFSGPHHVPTLEGQYVLKDVVLVAAGMVVSSTVRGGHLVRGARSAKPTEGPGDQRFAAPDKVAIVLDALRHDRDVDDVCVRHGIEPDEYRRWRDELLDGAQAAMSEPGEA